MQAWSTYCTTPTGIRRGGADPGGAMKPTEAIATISRRLEGGGDQLEPGCRALPDAAITAAHAAIVELVQYYAAMGRAEGHNPRPVTAANILMLANLRLDHLAGKAKTDPEARVRIVAELADLSSVLVEHAADIGVKTSREQREKARKPRKQAETKELWIPPAGWSRS